MRILIDGRMVLPEMSGVGRYILGLCRGLANLDSSLQYEVLVQERLSPDHPIFELAGERIRIRRVPLRHMSPAGLLHFNRFLGDSRPDLLHCPHFDLPFFVPGKTVATIHDLKYLAHPEFFPHLSRTKRTAMRLLMSRTCRIARALICDSQFTASELQIRLKVPKERITSIHLGVDAGRFGRCPAAQIHEFREKYALQRPFILFVGERRPHKNLPGLVRAFSRFCVLHGKTHQLVVAGGAYQDYSLPERTVAHLDLSSLVRFLDHIPEIDLPPLYQSADMLALLSFYEGFGLPVLEAMASGTPVTASNCSSLPEIAGDACLLVDPEDPESAAQAFARLVPGKPGRDDFIERGLRRAGGFTWENCARQTEAIYRKAIEA